MALTSLIVQELSIAFADSFGSLAWAFQNVVISASSKFSCLATSSHSEATVTTSHKDFDFPSFLYWILQINFILGRSSATRNQLSYMPSVYPKQCQAEHDNHSRRIRCVAEVAPSGIPTPEQDDSNKIWAPVTNKCKYVLLVYKNYI